MDCPWLVHFGEHCCLDFFLFLIRAVKVEVKKEVHDSEKIKIEV